MTKDASLSILILLSICTWTNSFLAQPSLVTRSILFSSSSNSDEKTLLERTKERIQAKMPDMQDDFPKRFKVRDFDEEAREEKLKAAEARKSIERKANIPSATFGSMSLEDLRSRMKETERPQKLELKQKLEDLNGIEPLRPLQFSVVALLMAAIGWQLTSFLSENFAIGFVDSNVYPMQRLAIVARNIVVGIMTLGTTFSAVIAVGLVFLSARVAIGVSKGELDPKKVVEESSSSGSSKDGAIRTTSDMLKQIFNSNDDKKQ